MINIQYKVRKIVKSEKQEVYGITIPNEVAQFFQDVYFTIEKSGQTIIMKSGCCLIPTKSHILAYDFSDCRIK